MDPLSLIAGFVTGAAAVLGLLHTALDIREKVWPKAPLPHPLAASLADIAAAIRERQLEGQ